MWLCQVEQYNLIVVVGAKDEADGTVTVRTRDAQMAAAVQEALAATGHSSADQQVVVPRGQLLDLCNRLVQHFK